MASLNIKTLEKIRDDYLRTYRQELIRRGIPNPNVSAGTEIYIKATSLAQQISVAMENTVLEGDSLMPDTAQDGALERFAGFFGESLRPASGSNGPVFLHTTVNSVTSILISADTQLQDSAGLLYKVTNTGSFKEGDKVEIESIDTGKATNLKTNATLRWVTIPAFATPIVQVAADFTGGTDAENIEGLRDRVEERLANPPGGGNWSQVANIAESSTSAVQKAFVYPACNGPATAGVAITSAPTTDYKGRDFNGDTTVLNSFVSPAVLGNFPEFADFIITNCVNKPIDVSIGLSLPNSKLSSLPGNGSGWADAVPFPTPIISGGAYLTGYSDVVNGISSTVFLVNADATSFPTTSVTVCWISKNDWIFRSARANVSGASSPYTVTLTPDSVPFTDSIGAIPTAGDYIFPFALNMSVYVDAILSQFGNLGPGQKLDPTLFPGLFPRAYRRPTIQDSWVSDLGPSILKFIVSTGSEILDVQYLFKQNVGAGPGKCPIPGNIQSGPFILTPKNIGFYPII